MGPLLQAILCPIEVWPGLACSLEPVRSIHQGIALGLPAPQQSYPGTCPPPTLHPLTLWPSGPPLHHSPPPTTHHLPATACPMVTFASDRGSGVPTLLYPFNTPLPTGDPSHWWLGPVGLLEARLSLGCWQVLWALDKQSTQPVNPVTKVPRLVQLMTLDLWQPGSYCPPHIPIESLLVLPTDTGVLV